MRAGTNQFQQQLLVEQVAEFLQFDRLARWLPGSPLYPPFLFLATFLTIDLVLVNAYKMATGYQHILVQSPTVIAGPLGVVVAAVGIRYMANTYSDAMLQLDARNREAESDVEALDELVAPRVKWGLYFVAVVVLYGWVIFAVGIENIVAFEGPAGLVNYLFVWEIGYLPFAIEFGLLYYSIHFALPRRIADVDLTLFHYDPRNMGGFAEIGQLLKSSYYLYTMGLLLYFILTYGPYLFSVGGSPREPGIVAAVFFSLAWFVGLLSIGYSMYRMHRIMRREKEAKIRELEAELRDAIENPHNITASVITDSDQYEDVQQRLEQVRSTRVYPATFTMWSQIAISAVLPQALQMAVQAV